MARAFLKLWLLLLVAGCALEPFTDGAREDDQLEGPGGPGGGAASVWSGTVNLSGTQTVAAGTTRRFDPAVNTTVTITGGSLRVLGTFEMRPNAGVTHRLVLAGINNGNCAGGGMEFIASDPGVWVEGAGRLNLVGKTRTAWARPTTGIAAGATSIDFGALPIGWSVGDELLVVPTAPGDFTSFETRTISAISGARVTLSSALSASHPAAGLLTPEVANLTRSVNLEGTAAGRAHIFIRNTSPVVQTVRHAGIRHMGVKKAPGTLCLGRYPLHFHHGFANNVGSVIEGVVVRESPARGIVQHHTHGTMASPFTIRDAVLYDIQEHAMWWDLDTATEDNSSDHVLWDRILVAKVTSTTDEATRLSAFFLGHGTATLPSIVGVKNSTAVGVIGGRSASGFQWPERAQSIWEFSEGNVTHNNRQFGMFEWHNGAELHDVSGFTNYHNGSGGISHGAYRNVYDFHDATLIGGGSGVGVELHAVGGRNTMTGQVLALRRIGIDGFATGIQFPSHASLPATAPAQIEDVEITNTPRPVVVNDPNGVPTVADFCRTTVDGEALAPADFTLTAVNPGTVIRIEDAAGSARRFTPSGGWVSTPSFCP